jgi:outer membrane protein assembly factor BamE (lipoprotein component of BamABCDE complex)
MNIQLKKYLLSISAAALLCNCSPTKHTRGNIIQDYQLSKLEVNVDTKTQVMRKIGSPTTIAPFDDNTWYYIGQKTEKRGILDEDVIEEKIVVVTFNQQGQLIEVKQAENEHEDIPYVRRKTPTSGNEVTVLQQLMGNLGKFNPEE